MKFRFRLEKVLELRRSELDELRMQMEELEARRRRAEQELLAAEEERQSYSHRCDRAPTRPMTPLELQSRCQTAALHRRQIAILQERLGQVEGAVAQLRSRLLEANRRVKILERLREKKVADYLREMDAQERKILDDIPGRKGGRGLFGSALPSESSR